MSLELVNTIATLGTFLVIAATAIAAMVQLRHARGSNQIAALDELREAFQSREFSDAQAFIDTQFNELVKNPAFRYQYAHRAARTAEFRDAIERVRLVGNYFEDLGALIHAGLLDSNITIPIYGTDITRAWDALQPLIPIARRQLGDSVWENFEYVTVLAQDWMAAHPRGGYPPGVRRIALKDEWLEVDRQYAASLATT